MTEKLQTAKMQAVILREPSVVSSELAVGLTEKGKLESMPGKEFCECISSHTGRRTFATNAYLSDVPTLNVMRITGHRTEKAFLRYVRLSKLHAAQRISKHYKKIAGSHLKVAI